MVQSQGPDQPGRGDSNEPTLVELEDAFTNALEHGAPDRIAESASALAGQYAAISQAPRALEVLDLAIARIDSAEYIEAVAELDGQCGTILHYGMARPEAAERFEDAITGFTASGNRKRRADMTYNLGNSLISSGRFKEAVDRFRDAAAAFESLEQPLDASDCLVAQSLATHAAGAPTRADGLLARAKALANSAGDPLRVPHFLTGLTLSLEWSQAPETGDWAFSHARHVLEPHWRVDATETLLLVLSRWMRWAARSGRSETALAVSRELVQVAESADASEHRVYAHVDAAQVLFEIGELDGAMSALDKAEALMTPDDSYALASAQLARGLIYMEQGLIADAEKHFQTARTGFAELGAGEDGALAAGSLGVVRLREERFSEARDLFIEQRNHSTTPLSRGLSLANLAAAHANLGIPSRDLLVDAHHLLGLNTRFGVLAATSLALSLVMDEPQHLAQAQQLALLVEDRIKALPRAQQPQFLLQLGNAVEEWDQQHGDELFARAERLARETGALFIAAAATASRAQHYLDEERWDEALTLLRQSQALGTEMGSGLHRVEIDNRIAWVLAARSDSSGPASEQAPDEALDLAVTSYLGFEARRRGITSQADRLSPEDAQRYWEAAVFLAADADDLDTVAELIEFRNSLGPPARDRVDHEASWARHHRLPSLLVEPAYELLAELPGVALADRSVEDDSTVATHLAAGLGDAVAGNEAFPMELPPLIKRPDGSVCLARYAELARTRYGISVFSDRELQIGSRHRADT